jgi:single-stranded-DNA-specific exonuclease
VIGIVASRLKDKFYRPTITFAPGDEGLDQGFRPLDRRLSSARCAGSGVQTCAVVITKFGGHAMAAGLTIRAEAFDAFAAAFEEVGKDWLSQNQLERVVETDGVLEDAYYSVNFISLMDDQVWGQGFAPPVFCDRFRVLSQRILKEKHLKLLLEKNGQKYDAIWFGNTDALPDYATVAFRLDANEYNGTTKVQLMVEHAEPA